MTVRNDILSFLDDPEQFSATLPSEASELWRAGLEEFALPRLQPPGRTLCPAQLRAWKESAGLRTSLVLGPPGTGKTFLLSWMAAGFLWAAHRAGRPCRILVTGFTREAIGNLLDGIARITAEHLPGTSLAFLGNRPDQGLASGIASVSLAKADLPAVGRWLERKAVVVGSTVWSLFKILEGGVLKAMVPRRTFSIWCSSMKLRRWSSVRDSWPWPVLPKEAA